MGRRKKTTKDEEKSSLPAKSIFSHFFWAYGSRGNSREFFSFIFPVSWILKEKNQLPDFFADFHFDILLIVLMICQKNICQFFLGDRSWTKNWCKFWILEFWFWGFGFWSFDFGGLGLGVLILGVWILEFWCLILEFWFWGNRVYPFDVSKHEVGRTSSDPSY